MAKKNKKEKSILGKKLSSKRIFKKPTQATLIIDLGSDKK